MPSQDLGRIGGIGKELLQLKHDYLNAFDTSRNVLVTVQGDVVDSLPQRILDKVLENSSRAEGAVQLRISTRDQLFELLGWVRSSRARESIYREFTNQFEANIARLKRTAELRCERAKLLGFASHAEYSMSNRMEKSSENIQALLDSLITTLSPARDVLLRKWRALKEADVQALAEPNGKSFYVWDRPYYSRVLSDTGSDINGSAVTDGFDLDHSIRTMLDIFEDLFALRFIGHACTSSQDENVPDAYQQQLTWHKDVIMYAAWDTACCDGYEEKFLGWLYMDLYMREGKRPGFSDQPVRPVRVYPATRRVCTD